MFDSVKRPLDLILGCFQNVAFRVWNPWIATVTQLPPQIDAARQAYLTRLLNKSWNNYQLTNAHWTKSSLLDLLTFDWLLTDLIDWFIWFFDWLIHWLLDWLMRPTSPCSVWSPLISSNLVFLEFLRCFQTSCITWKPRHTMWVVPWQSTWCKRRSAWSSLSAILCYWISIVQEWPLLNVLIQMQSFIICWEKAKLTCDCFWCFPSRLLPPPVFFKSWW